VYAIKEIRKSLKITQSELAKAIDTTQAAVSRYENGEANLTLVTAAKIAAALGCKVDDLIKEE
jgi:UDP-N-acetylglucosamine 1-carboxyvinyltransferase